MASRSKLSGKSGKRGRTGCHGKHRTGPKVERVQFECAHCLTTFGLVPGEARARSPRFCSRECWAADIISRVPLRSCGVCGKTFRRGRVTGRTINCSVACARAARRKTTLRWPSDDPNDARCDKSVARSYMAEYVKKNRAIHNHRSREWNARNQTKKKEMRQRRRAAIRANPVSRVDLDYVATRDQMRCHICGLSVEPADLHFDHVIPIAHGGAHSVDNLAVSHAVCNRRKGARTLDMARELVSETQAHQ